eukprot:EG_transcript_54794
MASNQAKIISLVGQRKAPSWASGSPSNRPTSPTQRPTSPTYRPASPTGRPASPGLRRGSGNSSPRLSPPVSPLQPAGAAEEFPSGATKYTGGSTFQRTVCSSHKYGAK